jgi:hypothetical protein
MMRAKSSVSVVALSLTAILFLFSSSNSKDLWGKVTPEEWALTPPEDYPDAQLAVLVDVCTLTVEATGIRCERYARLKLFSMDGVNTLNEFGFLRDEDDKTVSFKAQTILPDGRIIKADKKSAITRSAGDWEELSVAFPAVEPECIVEVKYVGSHTRFTYLEPWNFQSELYTYLSRITIVLAPGFEYSALFTNVSSEFRTPMKDERANIEDAYSPYQLYTWERKNLSPVNFDEPYAGFTGDSRARLLCQLIKYEWRSVLVDFSNSWEKLGERLFDESVKPYMYGGDLDKLLAGIVIVGDDNITAMARIFRFVADSTTLVPHSGDEICNHSTVGDFLKSRAGTEFDINLLLLALLGRANIKSQLIFVPSREDYTLLLNAPVSWQLTNSLVLAEFDSSFAILDPANKFCKAGQISPEFLGQQGLAVAKKGSRVINVGESEGRSYRLDATEMIIDTAGIASCSTTIGMTGSFPAYYGRNTVVRSDSSWIDFFILDRIDDDLEANSSEFKFTADGKISCWARYNTDLYSRHLENNVFVKPVVLRFAENPFTAARRSFPIDFQFPGTWHNLVTIWLPKDPTAMTLPADVSIAIDGATFTRACQRNGSVVTVDSRLVITKPLFVVEYYSEIKKFFDQIATASTDEVSAAF